MNLTGKELVEQGIITDVGEDCIQQVGVDLELIGVERLFGVGSIPRKGKTKLVQYKEVQQSQIIVDGQEVVGWQLMPGTYSIKFQQGCKIPANQMLLIRQRSSLLRNGGSLHSSVFDPGFETKFIGTVMVITQPIEIEFKARIAQIYAHQWNEVKNLYSGQFQGDLQRKKA